VQKIYLQTLEALQHPEPFQVDTGSNAFCRPVVLLRGLHPSRRLISTHPGAHWVENRRARTAYETHRLRCEPLTDQSVLDWIDLRPKDIRLTVWIEPKA